MSREVTEAILSSGQNEGIERSVLPLPQLRAAQNARQRKVGRWGKRFGTTGTGAVNSSGNAIGNGTGNVRSVGADFIVTDDQCSVWDRNGAKWADPKLTAGLNISTFNYPLNPKVAGCVSGWLPDKSFYPVPPLNSTTQTTTPCAQAYFGGYLVSAVQLLIGNESAIRVVFTDATDQTAVFVQDFLASVVAQGGNIYPRLVVCGSTLVLTYVTRPGNAARSVMGRKLTSVFSGFSAETSLAAGLTATGIYDVSSFSSTQFVLVSASAAQIFILLYTASTFTNTNSAIYNDALANITAASVVGSSTDKIYVTLGSSGAGPVATRVAVYDTALAGLIGTATLDTLRNTQAYSALLPGGGVRTIFGSTIAVQTQSFFWRDVTNAGVLVETIPARQFRFVPLSKPFTIGTQVYMWAGNGDLSIAVFGYLYLLRIPNQNEYATTLPGGAPAYYALDCPLEASVQDFTAPCYNDALGLPSIVQIGTSGKYSFLAPINPSIPDVIIGNLTFNFRAIQMAHYTDSASSRSVNQISADTCQFLPGAALTRVSSYGATEEGFAVSPVCYNGIASAGGSLTLVNTYQYIAVYRAVGANGRTELSGTNAPLSVTLTGANNRITLNILHLHVGMHANVQVDVYRTQGNGSIFYKLNTTSSIDTLGSGNITYVDTLADTFLTGTGHPVIYTQVGNALANGFPPPSRFGCSGGQRLWLGGLLRNDVVQCSKLIFGDQSPSFAASADQFSIVLPAAVTGLAWMDNLVIFTTEGIYIVSGDGPDDSGNGAFSPPNRLPYALGCIEPRSVVAVDEGTFFQTSRGLYLLPRGFGSPVPAGDAIMDTLATYPIITGNATITKSTEQAVYWTCVDAATPTHGATLVYDLVHKCWSVDFVTDPVGPNVTTPHTTCATWYSGEVLRSGRSVSGTVGPQVSTSTFDDSGQPIAMQLKTGDLRPFGTLSQGVISKVDVLTELRSTPSTLSITKATEWGTSPASTRVFAAAAGDYAVGALAYTETELGSAELRDAVALSITWAESSAAEGLAFIAMAVEHEQGEGLKRVTPLSRTT